MTKKTATTKPKATPKAPTKKATPTDQEKIKRPTNEEFVRAWQASAGVDEVAKRLDQEPKWVRGKAGYLRMKGIPLKKMVRKGKSRIDVEGLQKLCDELK